MKLGVIFGSSSNEHEVSVVSASSIIKNLNKEKYQIIPIYLNKNNEFFLWKEEIEKITPLPIGILPTNIEKIANPFEYLKEFDLIFLMIHGKNGEDGILSSILEFLKIPYIGHKPAASVVTMDKIITKEILEKSGIKTSPYLSFSKYNEEYIYQGMSLTKEEIIKTIHEKIKYPLFVKPANSGSSIGVTKVTKQEELEEAMDKALKTDHRILIEEGIIGREIECGILEEKGKVKVSVVGEVLSAEEFYSFSAKYTNQESNTIIPANIEEKITKEVREIAKKAFQILDCHLYSRCDFFLTKKNEIILNEINTIPGFTEISMYPKLFEESGIPYSELLDILINESLKKGKE